MTDPTKPFWETKSLDQMTADEWESLATDAASAVSSNSKMSIAARSITLISAAACLTPHLRCKDYEKRKQLVPDCVQLSPIGLITAMDAAKLRLQAAA